MRRHDLFAAKNSFDASRPPLSMKVNPHVEICKDHPYVRATTIEFDASDDTLAEC